jgi:hypothetical protein
MGDKNDDKGLINKSVVAALCESDNDITLDDVLATVKPTDQATRQALIWALKHCNAGLWAIDLERETLVGCKADPKTASLFSVILSRMVSDSVLESRELATKGRHKSLHSPEDAMAEFAKALKAMSDQLGEEDDK